MGGMSEALLSRFSGVTTLCLCWRMERQDGVVLGVTDHDLALTWQGETYSPGLAVSVSSMTHTLSLAPEPLDLDGSLDADAMTDADVRAGLWDGAKVTIWQVDWSTGVDGVWLWSGYLTRMESQGAAFTARLASQKSDLERTIGRVYGRRCDARFCDDRCGLERESVPQSECDKAFVTCRDVFGNAANFRGFPFMPGNDAVIAGPGDVRDGSGRGIIR